MPEVASQSVWRVIPTLMLAFVATMFAVRQITYVDGNVAGLKHASVLPDVHDHLRYALLESSDSDEVRLAPGVRTELRDRVDSCMVNHTVTGIHWGIAHGDTERVQSAQSLLG